MQVYNTYLLYKIINHLPNMNPSQTFNYLNSKNNKNQPIIYNIYKNTKRLNIKVNMDRLQLLLRVEKINHILINNDNNYF